MYGAVGFLALHWACRVQRKHWHQQAPTKRRQALRLQASPVITHVQSGGQGLQGERAQSLLLCLPAINAPEGHPQPLVATNSMRS
jgi:hypothetical protein